MQGIVESLLALARFESGQTPLRPEAIDLRELVEAVWRPLSENAASRGITFDVRMPVNLACYVDREVAQMIVAAILSNSAEYTDKQGHVVVAGRSLSEFAEVTIANTGCSLPAEAAVQVFDRFWRGDSARTNTGIHCGLGLALVQRAMSAAGGSVSARIADGTFSIILKLPAGAAFEM